MFPDWKQYAAFNMIKVTTWKINSEFQKKKQGKFFVRSTNVETYFIGPFES